MRHSAILSGLFLLAGLSAASAAPLDDQPRMFFVHFWAQNDLSRLLTGLKAALAEVAVQKS